MSGPTDIEKENLEAHVELCAERYAQLERRLGSVEKKVETLHADIINGQKSISKVLIGTAGTVVAAAMGTITTILMKF